MKTHKKTALLTAAVLAVGALSVPCGTASAADDAVIKVEFESGTSRLRGNRSTRTALAMSAI